MPCDHDAADNDGDDDMLSWPSNSNSVVWVATSGTRVRDWDVKLQAGVTLHGSQMDLCGGIVLEDMNGDAYLDVVMANADSWTVQWFMNRGTAVGARFDTVRCALV